MVFNVVSWRGSGGVGEGCKWGRRGRIFFLVYFRFRIVRVVLESDKCKWLFVNLIVR